MLQQSAAYVSRVDAAGFQPVFFVVALILWSIHPFNYRALC
jgi:hypothetical protein